MICLLRLKSWLSKLSFLETLELKLDAVHCCHAEVGLARFFVSQLRLLDASDRILVSDYWCLPEKKQDIIESARMQMLSKMQSCSEVPKNKLVEVGLSVASKNS